MNFHELGQTLYNRAFEPTAITAMVTRKESKAWLDPGIQLIIKNNSQAPLNYVKAARECGLSTLTRIKELIPLKDCQVMIYLLGPRNDLDFDMRNPYVEGIVRDSTAAHISIYSLSDYFGEQHRLRTQGVIAHESHHLIRKRGPGIGKTLFEKIVSEGLAQCFAEDFFRFRRITPEFESLTEKQIRKYWEMAKEFLFDSEPKKETYYVNWFDWGSPPKKLPSGIGHILGYYFVRNYLKNHPFESSASLAQTPATHFLE